MFKMKVLLATTFFENLKKVKSTELMAAQTKAKLLGSQPGLWTQQDSEMVVQAFNYTESVGGVTADNLDKYCTSKGKKYCIMSIQGIVDGMGYDKATFGYAVWGYNNKWWMFVITSAKSTNDAKDK